MATTYHKQFMDFDRDAEDMCTHPHGTVDEAWLCDSDQAMGCRILALEHDPPRFRSLTEAETAELDRAKGDIG